MAKLLKWLVLLGALIGIFFFVRNLEAPLGNKDIVVESPKAGGTISSPLELRGEAKGTWYFEASAPVSVVDAEGKVLGMKYITALGEWMTTDFVPFSGTIEFSTPSTDTGEIIFKNDNPSGDPERDKFFRLPVRFR